MNIEEYIASGVLEQIALGLASEEELREFANLVKDYPELQAELDSIKVALDSYALGHSVTPPAELKDKIWAEIEVQDTQIVKPSTQEEGRVLPIKSGNGNSYKWLAAASIVLLIGTSISSYVFYTKWQAAEKNLISLIAEKEYYANQIEVQKASLQQYENELAMVSQPGMQMIGLKGVEKHPEAFAMVYFNTETKEVYLKPQNLPLPPSDKQYQLWAIVDGKPVDAGVFDMTEENIPLSQMKSFDKAQAFAITLEKKGGSPVPTLEEMYVVGNV